MVKSLFLGFYLIILVLFGATWFQIFFIRIRSPQENKRITFFTKRKLWSIVKMKDEAKDQRNRAIISTLILLFFAFMTGFYYYIFEFQEEWIEYLYVSIPLGVVIYLILFTTLPKLLRERYISLISLYFIPMSMLDAKTIITNAPHEIADVLPSENYLSVFLPFELMSTLFHKSHSGTNLLIIPLIMFLINIAFLLINSLNPTKESDLRYYIWKNNNFIPYPLTQIENKPSILLLHGMSGSLKTWSGKAKWYEEGKKYIRIFDYPEVISNNYQLIAIEFTNKLKDDLRVKYEIADEANDLKLFDQPITKSITLNNYTWELLFVLDQIFQHGIENLKVFAHSTGGLVLRDLMNNVYEDKGLLQSFKGTFDSGYISQVNFLATPHFGANGGSAILKRLIPGGMMKYKDLVISTRDTVHQKSFKSSLVLFLTRVLRPILQFVTFLLSPIYLLLNNTGRRTVALVEDAQGALDLDVRSRYLQEINKNSKNKQLPVYNSKIVWNNVFPIWDLVVGSGSEIKLPSVKQNKDGDRLNSSQIRQGYFEADHSNFIIEQVEQFFRIRLRSTPSVHHSFEVYEWIFQGGE